MTEEELTEPYESDLTPKPQIDAMPPEEGDPPLDSEHQFKEGDIDFLDHTRAEADDTIDNEESESYPDVLTDSN